MTIKKARVIVKSIVCVNLSCVIPGINPHNGDKGSDNHILVRSPWEYKEPIDTSSIEPLTTMSNSYPFKKTLN